MAIRQRTPPFMLKHFTALPVIRQPLKSRVYRSPSPSNSPLIQTIIKSLYFYLLICIASAMKCNGPLHSLHFIALPVIRQPSDGVQYSMILSPSDSPFRTNIDINIYIYVEMPPPAQIRNVHLHFVALHCASRHPPAPLGCHQACED